MKRKATTQLVHPISKKAFEGLRFAKLTLLLWKAAWMRSWKCEACMYRTGCPTGTAYVGLIHQEHIGEEEDVGSPHGQTRTSKLRRPSPGAWAASEASTRWLTSCLVGLVARCVEFVFLIVGAFWPIHGSGVVIFEMMFNSFMAHV
jgi:hypothetical protein